MGLGGGTVLIIYLSVFLQMQQLKSQGINLLFFIPCAVLSIIVFSKQKLIEKEVLPFLILFGILGVILGQVTLSFIDTSLLSKLFGIFLIALSVKEFFFSKDKTASKKN